MTGAAAALLLAAAVVVLPGPRRVRARLPGAAPGPVPARAGVVLPLVAGASVAAAAVALLGGGGGALAAAVLGPGAAVLTVRLQRERPPARTEPLALAGAWDLLAACLRAGLPVPAAVGAVAAGLPAPAGPVLRRTGDLLALGADPALAWEPALGHPDTARLAGAARRSGRSGTALAGAAAGLAVEARAGARATAEARAQRAGVLVTGPLGLCFLPAFLVLGVVPVVIGLASGLVERW